MIIIIIIIVIITTIIIISLMNCFCTDVLYILKNTALVGHWWVVFTLYLVRSEQPAGYDIFLAQPNVIPPIVEMCVAHGLHNRFTNDCIFPPCLNNIVFDVVQVSVLAFDNRRDSNLQLIFGKGSCYFTHMFLDFVLTQLLYYREIRPC